MGKGGLASVCGASGLTAPRWSWHRGAAFPFWQDGSGKRAAEIGAEFVLVLEMGWGEMKWGETTRGEVGRRGERVRGDGAGDHRDLERRTPWAHAIL